MATLRVQSAIGTSANTTITKAFPSNVTVGNILIAQCMATQVATLNAPTDTLGNTWKLVGTKLVGSGSTQALISVYWAKVTTGGADSVTFSITGAFELQLIIAEYSGADTAYPIDTVAGVTSAGATTVTTTTIGPTTRLWQSGNEWMVSGFMYHGSAASSALAGPSNHTVVQSQISSSQITCGYSDYSTPPSTAQSATWTATNGGTGSVAGILFGLRDSGFPFRVQWNKGAGGLSPQSATLTNATALGNTLVAVMSGTNVDQGTTDTRSNTYSNINATANLNIASAPVTTAGTTTATATFSTGASGKLYLMEYSGLQDPPLDRSNAVGVNQNSATTSPSISTTGTLSAVNEIAIAIFVAAVSTTGSAPAAVNLISGGASLTLLIDRITTTAAGSTDTETGAYSTSQGFDSGIAVFKVVAVAVAPKSVARIVKQAVNRSATY